MFGTDIIFFLKNILNLLNILIEFENEELKDTEGQQEF